MDKVKLKEFSQALKCEFDYAALMRCIRVLADCYDFLGFAYLTETAMGRGIPLIKLGEGKKNIFYIGAHHGAERITAAVLVKFLAEFCAHVKRGSAVCGMNPEYITKTRTLYIVPMLNPDGVDISANGAPLDGLWRERLVKMNGSTNFTNWQANARGVDLNHNYDADFAEYKQIESELDILCGAPSKYSGEAPESEFETGALCNFLRFNTPSALMTLHTQGREIYYTSKGKCPPESLAVAKKLSSLTGYKLREPSGSAAYGGLTDFCIQKLYVPSFTLECGKGKNPLPKGELPYIYSELRSALFTFPSMF